MQILLVIALIIFGLGVWVVIKHGIKLNSWLTARLAPFNKRKIREDDQVRNTLGALVKAGFYENKKNINILTSSIASSELTLMVELNPKLINRLLDVGIESVTTRELIRRFIDANADASVINYLMGERAFGHYLINKYNSKIALIGYC